MAYSEEIDRRILSLVEDWEGVERKKMFGGTCHLLGGHMFCGVLDDKPFKGVQTGGPSGGCIPADLLDTGVDYDSLGAAGSIMGSGGLIIMDDTSCMVDVAKYFAWRRGLPLFQVPTAMSVNAPFGHRAGLRVDGKIQEQADKGMRR